MALCCSKKSDYGVRYVGHHLLRGLVIGYFEVSFLSVSMAYLEKTDLWPVLRRRVIAPPVALSLLRRRVARPVAEAFRVLLHSAAVPSGIVVDAWWMTNGLMRHSKHKNKRHAVELRGGATALQRDYLGYPLFNKCRKRGSIGWCNGNGPALGQAR